MTPFWSLLRTWARSGVLACRTGGRALRGAVRTPKAYSESPSGCQCCHELGRSGYYGARWSAGRVGGPQGRIVITLLNLHRGVEASGRPSVGVGVHPDSPGLLAPAETSPRPCVAGRRLHPPSDHQDCTGDTTIFRGRAGLENGPCLHRRDTAHTIPPRGWRRFCGGGYLLRSGP